MGEYPLRNTPCVNENIGYSISKQILEKKVLVAVRGRDQCQDEEMKKKYTEIAEKMANQRSGQTTPKII